jgi:hypothetical protein
MLFHQMPVKQNTAPEMACLRRFWGCVYYSNSAQGNLFSLSVALFQAFEMAVFLPFITIILFFRNFRYHSGIIKKQQSPVKIYFK